MKSALYDALKSRESDVFSQLHTGMVRVNSYLRRIGPVELDICNYRQATEIIEYFLF